MQIIEKSIMKLTSINLPKKNLIIMQRPKRNYNITTETRIAKRKQNIIKRQKKENCTTVILII